MERYYFDHNATTPVSPEVLSAMLPLMTEVYGNASSIHFFGQMAKTKLDEARRQVAALLGATPEEIVFTSGGTEADNLAVLGAADGGQVITTTIEHSAVLATSAHAASVRFVSVDGRGVVDPDAIRRALQPDTKVISVMHANNELGVIQPIAEIAKIAKEAGVIFHSDGVQAAGKIPVNVNALGVDLYSISGHKIYGPKGVGALYVRKGTRIASRMFGGHHERDLRAGTENVAGAVGLGQAAQQILGDLEGAHLAELRDRLEQGILDRVPSAHINGAGAPRTPNTSNVRFDGVDSESLLIALDLDGFAVSSGSACSSGATEPSHVLTAIGLSKLQARSSVRFSLGRSNTVQQVDALIAAVAKSVERLRKLAPAYA
ncbi:MAG: cysteine desulfurase family protein [Bryobacteraceae bacterium]|jgi:cysteine desulfurase